MNTDTIKILQIKGYTMLYNDLKELRYNYNKLHNNEDITDTTHETITNQLKMIETELINYITMIANKEG